MGFIAHKRNSIIRVYYIQDRVSFFMGDFNELKSFKRIDVCCSVQRQ